MRYSPDSLRVTESSTWIILCISCLVLLSSCSDESPSAPGSQPSDNEPGGKAVAVTGIQPSVVYPGDTLTITGRHFSATTSANQVMFTPWVWGEVIAASTTSILAVVPEGATTGKVAVVIDQLSVRSADTLEVRARVPGISGIQPESAYAGDTITITGRFFGAAIPDNHVTFHPNVPATVVSASATTLSVIVPEAHSGKVRVTVDGTTAESATDFTVLTRSIDIRDIVPQQVSEGETAQIFCMWLPADVSQVTVGMGNEKANVLSIKKHGSGMWAITFQIPRGAVTGKVWVRALQYSAESPQVLVVVTRMLSFKNCSVQFTGLQIKVRDTYKYSYNSFPIEHVDTTYWTTFDPGLNTSFDGVSKGFTGNTYSFNYSTSSRSDYSSSSHVRKITITIDSVDKTLASLELIYSREYYSSSSPKYSSSNRSSYSIRLAATSISLNDLYEFVLSGNDIKSVLQKLEYEEGYSSTEIGSLQESKSKTAIDFECPPTAKLVVRFFD